MKTILISLTIGERKIQVPDHVHQILAVYKIFFPPETTVKLGKKRPIPIEQINPWPPPEQEVFDI